MSHTNKLFIPVFMTIVAFIIATLLTFAIGDLSNYDPRLSTGEVVLEQYHPREIVTTADGHRMVDTPGYWYIRIERDGKWREVRLHEWQTMHVNIGDWVAVRGDYDIDVF